MDRRVADARVNQVLCGKYTLEGVLGVGGYRAVHRNGHKAAVKILTRTSRPMRAFAIRPGAHPKASSSAS